VVAEEAHDPALVGQPRDIDVEVHTVDVLDLPLDMVIEDVSNTQPTLTVSSGRRLHKPTDRTDGPINGSGHADRLHPLDRSHQTRHQLPQPSTTRRAGAQPPVSPGHAAAETSREFPCSSLRGSC
jgi:hypothetical protein